MPSEKLTRILLAKSPFSAEQISEMTDAEGWQWVYSVHTPKKERQLEICFTGFSEADKGSLSQLAIDAGLMVVTAVTRKLLILCVGPNPGPAKLEKATKQGASVLTVEQFKHFLATSELPA